MTVKMQLFDTQAYLDENGVPERLEDLARHRLICQNANSAQVGAGSNLVQHLLTYDVKSLLTVNNYFGVLQGVLQNLGVGILPDYVSQDEPRIVHVLPEVKSADVPVFLAYPEELRQSKRIAAFRDFVQDEITAYRKTRRKNEKS